MRHLRTRTSRLAQPGTALAESFIAYLVIAIAFAQLYWILNRVVTQPFNQVIPTRDISTLLYFSRVTISSVGYGFITPVNPYERMVAVFESVTGLFYIAVVVAPLVSSDASPNTLRQSSACALPEAVNHQPV